MAHIGTLNEGSLHAALKAHLAQPGDRFEVPLGRFVIDIVRPGPGGDILIEIQTGSFAAMGNKLDHLLESHRVHLVHPLAVKTRLDRPGRKARTSPKKQCLHSMFEELVSVPTLLDHPNLSLEVIEVEVTKKQVADPTARRGRGGFRTVDRELDSVVASHSFRTIDDVAALLPSGLPEVFTTNDIASGAGIDRALAQKAAFCLRSTGHLLEVGRTRAGVLYERRPVTA